MNTRVISVVLVLGIAALGYFAWTRNQDRPAALATQQPSGETVPTEPQGVPDAGAEAGGMPGAAGTPAHDIVPPTSADAGIAWTAPKRWRVEAPRSMRLATYSIPALNGDPEDASCALYYFGPGQGGDVDANLLRWTGEFQDAEDATRSDETIHGMNVVRVRTQGTYLSHGGGTMEPQGTKSDYALLGAIVTGPNGSVFFKLTGPVKTVDAAEKEFVAMLRSMKKV